MAQQDVMYGQVSQFMHSREAPKDGNFQSQTLQRPAPYVGFVPFHQQQCQLTPPKDKQSQPFLSLSLECPDSQNGRTTQQQHEAFLRPTPSHGIEAKPSDVSPSNSHSDVIRPFDLEQRPLQPVEQSYAINESTEHLHQNQHDMELDHNTSSMHTMPVYVCTEEVNDSTHLQIFPESELSLCNQSGHQQHYPLASASHEDVIQDAELFTATLDNLHAALGTRLTVPELGGKEINLHAFYREVTGRGGLEQVIRASQWKNVAEALDIQRALPSSSFVLRKLYASLLFHYEQVYFFRAEGQVRTPPAPLPAPTPGEPVGDVGSPYEPPPEMKASLKKRKRKLDPIQVFGVDPAASVGSMAVGAISGKFEEGYFVTVVVGSEKLSGVLYHVPLDNKGQQFASVPSLVDTIGKDVNAPGMEIQLYGKPRKEYVRKVNPNAPKRTRTGYHIFFKEQRAKLKELQPGTKGLGKKVIEMWNNLSETEKAPYIALGNQERQIYLADFREKLKLQQELQGHDGADGILDSGGQQLEEDEDHEAYDVSHDYHVSLDVESDIQSGHPQISEMIDSVYDPYHVNGLEMHGSESELPGEHVASEQDYEVQEDEGVYPAEESMSKEEGEHDDDDHLQGAYDEDEEGMGYPVPGNVYEAQEDCDYHVAGQDSCMPEEAYPSQSGNGSGQEAYPSQVIEVMAQAHGGGSSPKQQYYGQDHAYPYAPSLPQHLERAQRPVRKAPYEQAPYQMRQDNGQVIYPHMQQQGQLEIPGENAVSQQQYYRYAYPQGRHGPGGEALGLPVPQDQGRYRPQDDDSSYALPYQSSQAVLAPNLHTRQVPSEVVERYMYPPHMQYPPMYVHPPSHAYPVRFPHPSYPMQMGEGQAMQYGHTYVYQPQASVPVMPQVSVPDMGLRAPEQVYQAPDGHAYCSQDGNPTPVYKHRVHK